MGGGRKSTGPFLRVAHLADITAARVLQKGCNRSADARHPSPALPYAANRPAAFASRRFVERMRAKVNITWSS